MSPPRSLWSRHGAGWSARPDGASAVGVPRHRARLDTSDPALQPADVRPPHPSEPRDRGRLDPDHHHDCGRGAVLAVTAADEVRHRLASEYLRGRSLQEALAAWQSGHDPA